MAKLDGFVKGVAAVVVLLEISPLVSQPARLNPEEIREPQIYLAAPLLEEPAPAGPASVLDTDVFGSLKTFERSIATSA